MDKNQSAKELISKYHQGTASPEERLLVEQWFLIDLEKSELVPKPPEIAKAKEACENSGYTISDHLVDFNATCATEEHCRWQAHR